MTENEVKNLMAAFIAELKKSEDNHTICPMGLKQETVDTLNEITPTAKNLLSLWQKGTASAKWFMVFSFFLGAVIVVFIGAYHQLKSIFESVIK
jgi:hypothetical protein